MSKRIQIEFREKGRVPAFTDYMPDDEAQAEFDRVARELEETGVEGDRWIRVSDSVVVRGGEVHNISLQELVLPHFNFGDAEDSIWNKQF